MSSGSDKGVRIMIKNPFNFGIGIFCGLCFVVGIINGRDAFTLFISAVATAVNITIGLNG